MSGPDLGSVPSKVVFSRSAELSSAVPPSCTRQDLRRKRAGRRFGPMQNTILRYSSGTAEFNSALHELVAATLNRVLRGEFALR